MVVNNKNSSPPDKKENEDLGKIFIIYKADNNNDIFDIIDILESRGIVSNFNFDRTDNKNTSKEHNNYYFNSKGNNNTLDAILMGYARDGIIRTDLIDKLSKEIEEMKEFKINGVVDNSNKATFKGFNDDLIDTLNYKENNDLNYIGQSSTDGSTKVSKFNQLSGINKDTIIKRVNMDVVFDKNIDDLDLDILKKEIEKQNSEYFSKSPELMEIEINKKDNVLNVSYNNVLKNPNANEYFIMSAKQYRARMESYISKTIEQSGLTLTTNKFIYVKDMDDLKPLKQEKAILTTKDADIAIKEDLSNSVKVEDGFKNEIKSLSKIEDFDNKTLEIEKAKEGLIAAKAFIPDFEKTLKMVDDKLAYINIAKNEFLTIQNKDEIIAIHKEDNAKLRAEILVLDGEKTTLRHENNDLKANLKYATEEVERATDTINKNNETIGTLRESITAQESTIKTLTETKDLLIEEISNKDRTIEAKDKNIEILTNAKNDYQRMANELKSENDRLTKENASLNTKFVNFDIETLSKYEIEKISTFMNNDEFDSYISDQIKEKNSYSKVLETLDITRDKNGNLETIDIKDDGAGGNDRNRD